MEKEIVKNLNRNYLKMECDSIGETDRYEYRMMNVDSIYGLLPCHIRFMNGEAYLYYDISATKSFASVFSERDLEREDMEKLAAAIRKTVASLEEHLLEGENLVFDPEMIFMDVHKEDIYFLYYPYYSRKAGKNFLHLAEFISTHIDHKDEKLVDQAYRLYEQTVMDENKLPFFEIFQFMENDTEGFEKLIEKQESLRRTEEIPENIPEDIPDSITESADHKTPEETVPSLSLFEYHKGRIRKKRISYAVEESSFREKYEDE